MFIVLTVDLNVHTIKVHEVKNVEATNPSGFVSCKFDVFVVFAYKEDKGKININKLQLFTCNNIYVIFWNFALKTLNKEAIKEIK